MLDPTWMPQAVLGWLDDTQVLVQAHRRASAGDQPPLQVLAWDVADGTTSPGIARPSSYKELDSIEIATEPLGQPLRAAERPGIGLPPWPVAVAIGLLLSGIAFALLRCTAFVLTGNHHDAEDLLQTALMKAAGVWSRIEQQAAALMGVGVGTIKSQTRHALARLRQVAPDLVSGMAERVDA